ncbi:MAG: hypothetical protein L0H15_12020 [Nitrosospira sp.]|nr:hypothetical protein [Nitrosospira sp.]MDN5836560.1 hypothetical protein [Nitrosospira sp.]MDN5881030.1 hypothetical protein [Nitrosospira sp.]
MATFSATDLNTKSRHMGGHGNAVVVHGSVTPAAGASGDAYRPVRIPAGVDVTDVDIINSDMDSGATPTIACKIGYEPVNAADGPAADDNYFAAAGNTLLRSAGRTALAFQPVKFEKDVFLTVTLSASAATFASGPVTAIVKGDGIGVK